MLIILVRDAFLEHHQPEPHGVDEDTARKDRDVQVSKIHLMPMQCPLMTIYLGEVWTIPFLVDMVEERYCRNLLRIVLLVRKKR